MVEILLDFILDGDCLFGICLIKYEPNTKDLIGHYAVINIMRKSSIRLPAVIINTILKLI